MIGSTQTFVPIPMALIGGGPGSFIGPVHRMAAELDGRFRLVAGSFSTDPDRSAAAGATYGVETDRIYPDIETLIAREAGLSDGVRIVVIATPNHLHQPIATASLAAGLAVMSDKPASATLDEAHLIARAVAQAAAPYRLSFTYTGYPMIRDMRARIATGEIGPVRKVMVEYLQGWLANAIEGDNKQAAWRVDPARSGVGGCISDIGVHAFNLLEFVTSDTVTQLNADLASVLPHRVLDDDCTVLLRLSNGARAVLAASQVATGARNNLKIRVYGERGALEWRHEASDRLTLTDPDGRDQTIWGGSAAIGMDATRASRLPSGHPEGYIEAFANLYRDFAALIRGDTSDADCLVPDITAGVRSMNFVETAVRENGAGWVPLAS